jgi:hypothetical protein
MFKKTFSKRHVRLFKMFQAWKKTITKLNIKQNNWLEQVKNKTLNKIKHDKITIKRKGKCFMNKHFLPKVEYYKPPSNKIESIKQQSGNGCYRRTTNTIFLNPKVKGLWKTKTLFHEFIHFLISKISSYRLYLLDVFWDIISHPNIRIDLILDYYILLLKIEVFEMEKKKKLMKQHYTPTHF